VSRARAATIAGLRAHHCTAAGSWLELPREGAREERAIDGAAICAFLGERHGGGDMVKSPERSDLFRRSLERSG
jgi:hypothetical protein